MKRPGPSHLRRDLSWVDLCPQHQVRSPTLDKGPHSLERKRRTHRTKAHTGRGRRALEAWRAAKDGLSLGPQKVLPLPTPWPSELRE